MATPAPASPPPATKQHARPAAVKAVKDYPNPFDEDRLNESNDYRPQWDVPSLNKAASDWLVEEVRALRASPGVSAARKVGVLLGPAGYGKTHLFGRIGHALGDDALFVFVPQIIEEQIPRPLQHLRWHVIETLFYPPPDRPRWVSQVLARLCRRSFESYFDALPAAHRGRHQALRQRLAEDPMAVMEILSPVGELAPYQRLADSVVRAFPKLRSDVVRALVLGWSPAGVEAGQWLRGDDLSEAECKRLQLGEEPPAAAQVIEAAATLLQAAGVPVVLCLDQLDAVLKDLSRGPVQLSADLMALLHEVPNLTVVLSCYESKWGDFLQHAHEAFKDRVHTPRKLEVLTEQQAVELATRRFAGWPGARRDKWPTWPIREPSIVQYVRQKPRDPRSLIQVCRLAMEKWLASGGDGEIDVVPPAPTDEKDLFVQHWTQELNAVHQGARTPGDIQEDELAHGVFAALQLAGEAGVLPPGVQLLELCKNVVHASPSDARPSLGVRVGVGGHAFTVVAAVTKRDSGKAFSAYFDALEDAVKAKGVVGAVLIRPKAELAVGPTAQVKKRYEKAVADGKIRLFPLDQEQITFHQLQCLLRVLKDADAGMLRLGEKTKSSADCRRLIAETKRLSGLKLFEFIFTGWPAIEAARAAQAVKPPSAPVPPAATPEGSGDAKWKLSPPAAQPALFPATSGSAKPAPKSTAPPPTPQAPAPAGPVPSAAAPLAPPPVATAPAVAPPVPAPADETQTWAEALLTKVTDQFRKWGLPVRPLGVQIGPSFARLKVHPADQTDINKLRNRAENLMVSLGLPDRPLIGFQAGYVSIDIERPKRQTVPLRPLLEARPAELAGQPAFPAGLDVAGQAHWLNLADTADCHLLIAGTTGSGKSEFMKVILASLAHALPPERQQFVLIDPKRVTFNFRGTSPYFRAPVAHEHLEAMPLIEECFAEMEDRYKLLEQRRKSNLSELAAADARPRVVVFFDEFADLMADKASKKELEALLKRIGAKARAAGIHLVLGTQRAEASVVTPLLRSNLPGRISLKVISDRDSQLILNDPGAADLLGKGDLLWRHGGDLLRLQSPFVSNEELERYLRIA